MRVGKEIVKANVSFVTCSRPHVTDGILPGCFRQIPFLCFPHIPILLKKRTEMMHYIKTHVPL